MYFIVLTFFNQTKAKQCFFSPRFNILTALNPSSEQAEYGFLKRRWGAIHVSCALESHIWTCNRGAHPRSTETTADKSSALPP